jgi:hypothetical protein
MNMLETEPGPFLWNEPGIWDCLGEIITRKFHLVYLHWIIALLFVLVSAILCIRAWRSTIGFLGTLPLPIKIFYMFYIFIVGLTLFNFPILTNSMLRWGALEHMKSMFWSLILAFIPVACTAIWINISKRNNIKPIDYILVYFITHTLMAFLYIFLGITFIE